MVREQLDMAVAVTRHAIQNLEAKMKKLEESVEELGRQARRLTSVTGIALTSARQILSEVGPVCAYPTPEKLALAAGLVPLPKRSGTSLNQTGLQPYGNPRLRRALYRCALVAKQRDAAFKAYAERIQAHGHKSKKTVIVACARKLAHVVWAILTNDEDYSQEIFMKQARLT